MLFFKMSFFVVFCKYHKLSHVDSKELEYHQEIVVSFEG